MAPSIGLSFLDHFAALRDPRQSWKVVYPLSQVLLTVLAGTIAGAEDFVEIRRWAKLHVDFLRRFLPFAKGITSHDTLNDIMNAIDGELFCSCFTQWVSSLGRRAENSDAGPENLLRGAKDKHSLKVRRKSAAWDDAYLEAVIRQAV